MIASADTTTRTGTKIGETSEVFLEVLRRWREIGGLVARDGVDGVEGLRLEIVKEENDSDIRENENGVYFVLGAQCKENLIASQLKGCATRVLHATCGSPGKEGIESWGDWEIIVEKIDKTKCPDFVSLTIHMLAMKDWDESSTIEGIDESMPVSMMVLADFLIPIAPPAWDIVLDRMGKNLTPSMFGADDDVAPISVMMYCGDGNTWIFFVDVIDCMYKCVMATS